ncbi:hypothetical protein J8352_09580, partial [Escherichia coli]|nr:hypothetical protein [Escherichia coli]
MINDLKSILLKSSEEVDVFIKIFESWRKKLPAISGPVNLYIPTRFKDKYLCSCPLISRQGLYLKLTLPADVDILAESDNPTHYADG